MNRYNFSTKPINDESEAIATVSKRSKENAGKTIYLNKGDADFETAENDILDLFYDYAKNRQIKQRDYDRLIDAIESNEPPEERKLKMIYNDFKTKIKKSAEVLMKNSELEVVPMIGYCEPNKKTRECILVNGKNGSGKSYWVGRYAEKWQKFFPKSPIWLLSNKPLSDEPEFSKLKKIKQIPITKNNLEEIIGDYNPKETLKRNNKNSDDESEELDKGNDVQQPYQYFKSHKTNESLVIFDDWEGGSLEKMIHVIIDSILEVGRSSRIYCIIITHELCAGKKGKMILAEVNGMCLFGEGISNYTLKYCLKNYTKMNENQIAKVVASNSPWVFVHNVPNYVIENNKLWLY